MSTAAMNLSGRSPHQKPGPAHYPDATAMSSTGSYAKRSLSNATSTTTSSTSAAPPRRSTSSRSTASQSPTSYVALMRKQKASVWCDRAQHEDPRMLAAQRAAKQRAAMEVAGGQHRTNTARTATSGSGMVDGVRSKIRHHGAPKASTYTGSNLMGGGGGVPMRLSASEVDDAGSDEDTTHKYHSRASSGRSSLASAIHHQQQYQQQPQSYARRTCSSDSTPASHSPSMSPGSPAGARTPMPNHYTSESQDYVSHLPSQPVPRMTEIEQQRQFSEELKRRGSVDDRAMTMSAGRLFVANPDLSD
ncbi:hypothetical protein K470DRAFT_278397 [Piedraia hortae CBS 480.64]|uniref:Uncharacterized protein n=1 Tax=Piedraia hortae CBS 480.64 TaxID=1314780 RepID=A0A6A7BTU1_9PEZI|nr:hypothetical protein K470DRAFT_278397 [Piedraia hortae CBS 480.64]